MQREYGSAMGSVRVLRGMHQLPTIRRVAAARYNQGSAALAGMFIMPVIEEVVLYSYNESQRDALFLKFI